MTGKTKKNPAKMNPKDKIYIIPEQKQIHRNTDRRIRWEGGYKSSLWVRKVILVLPGVS